MALLSSVYEGGRLKFVGSDLIFKDFASFKAFVCTGERGANSGEEIVKADGGGVDIGKLEGVLPAAAFFSICRRAKPTDYIHVFNCFSHPLSACACTVCQGRRYVQAGGSNEPPDLSIYIYIYI